MAIDPDIERRSRHPRTIPIRYRKKRTLGADVLGPRGLRKCAPIGAHTPNPNGEVGSNPRFRALLAHVGQIVEVRSRTSYLESKAAAQLPVLNQRSETGYWFKSAMGADRDRK